MVHKHFNHRDVKKIIKLIEEWDQPKLTWDLLVEACNTKLGISRARQSLMKLDAVALAFKDRKAVLKAPTQKPTWISDIGLANERIEQLTADNQKLKMINEKLLERFTIWQANADMWGVTVGKLDRPLVAYARKR